MSVDRFPTINKSGITNFNLGLLCSITDNLTCNDLSYKSLGIFVTVHDIVTGTNVSSGYEQYLDEKAEKTCNNEQCDYSSGNRAYWVLNKSNSSQQWVWSGANVSVGDTLAYDGSNYQKKFNGTETLTTKVSQGELNINQSINSLYADYTGGISFASNAPIFEDESVGLQYIQLPNDDDIELEFIKDYAVNYKGPEFDNTTVEYYAYNRYDTVSIERGIVSVTDNTVHQLNERILYNGSDICFYRTASNPFALSLKMGTSIVGSYFSNTGTIENVPYDEFLPTLEYTSPFYSTYDRELNVTSYQGYMGIGLATNIPIWDSEADADEFLAGNKDITEASNWNKISSDPAYKNIITNLTENPEVQTEFGEVYIRNIFSQMYLCDASSLYDISANLFDYTPDASVHGQWEKIKKGLEMYGSNPMDAIQGLRFYPFDLSSIFTDVQSQNYVYFGAYKQDIQGTVYKVIYANGYKDLGSISIKRAFKDWRDFEPYTKLSIYLPYVGRYQLDLNKYYDKTINIRYYLDIRTGACCACLLANGVLLDWFDGLIGTEMPITLTDYASYAQNQINIIMRNAGAGALGIHHTGNEANAISRYAIQADNKYLAEHPAAADYSKKMGGMSAGTAAAAATQIGSLAVGAAVIGGVAMKTAFDMTKNGIGAYTKTRPGSSAMINNFLPQYPTFMFEVMEIDESPYLNELYGRPTNASGTIGSFSGYLEAEDVMLICPIATDNERQEIIDLVKSGIYI